MQSTRLAKLLKFRLKRRKEKENRIYDFSGSLHSRTKGMNLNIVTHGDLLA